MDIDIDLPSSFEPLKIFPESIKASVYKDKKLTPHPCGVYFQTVPKDPITNLSAIPYDIAEQVDCFKIDFLHLTIYDYFSSKEEIKELLKHEPDWSLLEIPSIVKQLFQLGKHFDLLTLVKPRSIQEVADCLALIRPQKRFLLKYYLENKDKTRKDQLYKYDKGDGYAFKLGHAISYSLVIILQLHLIKAGISFD